MQAHILATRAVASEFLRRTMRPLLLWISGGIVAYLAVVTVLAVKYTAWWAMLYLPAILAVCLVALAWTLYVVSNTVIAPNLTRSQRKQVNQFVDKVQSVTEQVRTPYFIILFRILRDVYRQKDKGYLYSTITDSRSLASDFNKLAASLAK